MGNKLYDYGIETTLDTSPLVLRISRLINGSKTRFIAQYHENLTPLYSLSLYETYLSNKFTSHNSVSTASIL
jgi:hypothetical protein